MSESTAPKPRGYLRDSMPACAAFIDELRQAFGAEPIDLSIKLGMAGVANKFHASEGGREIGTAFNDLSNPEKIS